MTPESTTTTLMNRAYDCLDRNAVEDARALFVQVCEMDASNAEAWLMCGAIAVETGAINAGIRLMEKAIGIAPNDAHAHYTLARALIGAGRMDSALKHAAMATELDTAHVEAWVLRGGLAGQLGRFDDAESSSRKALALSPLNTEALVNLASALHQNGRHAEAVEAYHNVRKRGIETAQSLCGHAHALIALGRYREAGEILDTVVTQSPASGAVLLQAGMLREACGEHDAAITLFARVAELMPDDPAPLMRAAEALVRMGRETEARVHFERAQALARRNNGDPRH